MNRLRIVIGPGSTLEGCHALVEMVEPCAEDGPQRYVVRIDEPGHAKHGTLAEIMDSEITSAEMVP